MNVFPSIQTLHLVLITTAHVLEASSTGHSTTNKQLSTRSVQPRNFRGLAGTREGHVMTAEDEKALGKLAKIRKGIHEHWAEDAEAGAAAAATETAKKLDGAIARGKAASAAYTAAKKSRAEADAAKAASRSQEAAATEASRKAAAINASMRRADAAMVATGRTASAAAAAASRRRAEVAAERTANAVPVTSTIREGPSAASMKGRAEAAAAAKKRQEAVVKLGAAQKKRADAAARPKLTAEQKKNIESLRRMHKSCMLWTSAYLDLRNWAEPIK